MTPRTFDLRAHLETSGHVSEHGTSRAASRRICRDCGQPVVRALDADLLAFEVTVDPTPVNPVGELLALAAGRRTYDGIHVGGRLELEPRRPAHITQHRYPVFTDHHCGAPLPAAAPTAGAAQEDTNEPPF